MVTWIQLTFGKQPYFCCPRCSKRRVFLYHDGLFCYCRVCADLWYRSQQVRIRTRLLHRSRRIRISLGSDQLKPGSPFPPRPYLQTRQRYQRIIAKLKTIEQRYMHIITHDRRHYERERDERGRLLPSEASAANSATGEATSVLGR